MSESHGFQYRHALPLLVVFAAVLGGLGMQTVRSHRELLDQEVDRHIVAAAQDLSSRAVVSLILEDGIALEQEIERTLAQGPDTRFGLFREVTGRVVAQATVDSIPVGVTDNAPVTEVIVRRLPAHVVATAPVLDGSGVIRGDVSVGISTARLDAALRRSTYEFLGIASIAFLLVAVLASRLMARIEGLTSTLERRVKERTVELAAARDRAMDASRLKSEFLANMSHEIRTPMHGVTALSELLLTTELDERQRRYAATLHRSGGMLLAIINDILDISKIEAGKLKMELIPFDPREVLQNSVDLLTEQASEKDLTLTFTVEGTLEGPVLGDAVRVGQVVTNLVGNAIKFTEEGGVGVTLVVTPEGGGVDRVRVSVSDTGPGISPEYRSSLFDAFTQEDASTTRRFGGTGLGLAICKQLVHLMGGTIGVDSEVGEGSVFWFEAHFERASADDESSPRRSRVRATARP